MKHQISRGVAQFGQALFCKAKLGEREYREAKQLFLQECKNSPKLRSNFDPEGIEYKEVRNNFRRYDLEPIKTNRLTTGCQLQLKK
ncbi:MAG: hypothetical protein A2298_01940 [Gammaproteobacteria bacterium RIFOXYB2_FULL_38_6]|nr:MAG: hypothetical protein A2298_01940 [Gammaproteobacteria bacterium RIFOXYB2_FULL_38_6]